MSAYGLRGEYAYVPRALFNLNRELELMSQAGLSTREILVAATRNGAITMGRERDVGTLQPGKLADMLVLNANPLEDIRHSRRIAAIVKGGVLYQSEWLMREFEVAEH